MFNNIGELCPKFQDLPKLYILKTSHCGWNPEQNSTYNSPRIINVREIDRNYWILTINKRLFTMKVENHDMLLNY
jgi:hypothetical protein